MIFAEPVLGFATAIPVLLFNFAAKIVWRASAAEAGNPASAIRAFPKSLNSKKTVAAATGRLEVTEAKPVFKGATPVETKSLVCPPAT